MPDPHLNAVQFSGRLVGEPNLSYDGAARQIAIADFVVGQDYVYRDGRDRRRTEEVLLACQARGAAAEHIAHHLEDGSWVELEGRLRGPLDDGSYVLVVFRWNAIDTVIGLKRGPSRLRQPGGTLT